MKVSKNWLKELVDLKVPIGEIIRLLPLRTIGIKEEASEYFELDMKGYNRADLLSMRGVAYEIAAITGSKIFFSEEEWQDSNLPKTDVRIEDEALAPLYCIAKIEGLKVEHSNETWVKKLNDSGIRAVNNVADITNLIMLEYGQPMHSFDAQKVKDATIIVRTAKEGEEIITLDGKTRRLNTTDLLITDPEKAVGIAGVMGGQNSEITNSTTSILLEAAIFDPINLRKTATGLGLQSEASKRFQHGLTKKRLLRAFDAAIKMYEGLGGKVSAITLAGDLEDKEKKVILTKKRLNTIAGIEIDPEDVEDYLKRLNFTVIKIDEDWEVTVPYFRLDIEIEDDLIEEVARMYGYEKIPAKQLTGNIPTPAQNPVFELLDSLKQTLVNAGLIEVQTYSYYSTEVLNNLSLNTKGLIKILNPMSAETEYMRSNLWPNLLEATAKNIRNGIKDVTIFEIGKTYRIKDGQPKEGYRLSIALSNGTNNPLAELSVVAETAYSVHLGGGLGRTPREYFHPTRFAGLEKDGKEIGWIGEVHPRIVNKFGIEQRIAVLEIEL